MTYAVIDSSDGSTVYRTFEQLSREYPGMDEAFYTGAFSEHVVEVNNKKLFIYKEENT
jgi:hypothetical protein